MVVALLNVVVSWGTAFAINAGGPSRSFAISAFFGGRFRVMLAAATYSISINRDWRAVYDAICGRRSS